MPRFEHCSPETVGGPQSLTSLPAFGIIRLSRVSNVMAGEGALLEQLLDSCAGFCLFIAWLACKTTEAIKTEIHETYLKNRDFKNARLRVKKREYSQIH